MDIPPHLVANNKNLLELSKARPSSSDQLLKVDGMSVVKVKRIGVQVLEGLFRTIICSRGIDFRQTQYMTFFAVISKYCQEKEASRDNFPDDFQDVSSTQVHRQRNETGVPTQTISETVRSTYSLFHERRLSLVSIESRRLFFHWAFVVSFIYCFAWATFSTTALIDHVARLKI